MIGYSLDLGPGAQNSQSPVDAEEGGDETPGSGVAGQYCSDSERDQLHFKFDAMTILR